MITDFDFQILNFLQQYCRTEELDWFFSNITRLGNAGILWILFAAILLLIPKTRRCGMIVSLALLLDFVVCNGILKNLIARIRPYDINTAVELLIEKPLDYSFPSGHTAASFAVVTVLYCTKSRLRYPAFCIAVLIAFSRMYLYVHYPTDILGGVLVGMFCGCAAVQIFQIWMQRRNQKKQQGICPSNCTGSCRSCPSNKR